MPTVTLNKAVVEKYIGKKLTLDTLKDRISMLGTDLEKIEGNNIYLEVFPNRPDLLSEPGLGRALANFTGSKAGLQEYNVKKSGHQVIIDKSVSEVRPFTSCAIVKNLKFDDEKIREVIQIQEKLHVGYGRNRQKVAIGIYPLEQITFPITFFGENPAKIKFIPLGLSKELDGLQILSQHPAGRDYASLLEGKKVFPFFKDKNGKILSMPPIINSNDVGKIGKETKAVFIECSGFDYAAQSKALSIIVTALADIGGEIYSLELVYPTKRLISPDLSPRAQQLDLVYVNKVLGLNLSLKEVITLLSRMGFGFKDGRVLIPAYRADIMHQIDMVEDIAIAYGYENFKETIPSVATIAKEGKLAQLKNKLAELLIGLGISEVCTYNISKDSIIPLRFIEKKPVLLANSLSEDFNCLRSSMIPSILEVLSKNMHNEYPQKIFDLGTVFLKGNTETGVSEEEHLVIALTQDSIDFTAIKQVVNYLLSNFGLACRLKECNSKIYLQGRAGEIYIGAKCIGALGEISPEILSHFKLEYPVACLEIDLGSFFSLL